MSIDMQPDEYSDLMLALMQSGSADANFLRATLVGLFGVMTNEECLSVAVVVRRVALRRGWMIGERRP